MPTEPHPRRPTQGQAHGEEACRQPHRAPGPRRGEAGQSFREDAAWACRMGAEQPADAELPCDPVATPREIGHRPGVATVDMPSWDTAPWAAGYRLYGRDQEGELHVRVVEVPGVQLERDGVGQYMGQRVSNLHRCLSVRALRESSINIHLEQPRERPHQNWPRAPYNMQTPFSSLSRLFNQRSESSFRIPKTLVRITSTAAVFPENPVAAGSPNL
jgi:hypothetical protein